MNKLQAEKHHTYLRNHIQTLDCSLTSRNRNEWVWELKSMAADTKSKR